MMRYTAAKGIPMPEINQRAPQTTSTQPAPSIRNPLHLLFWAGLFLALSPVWVELFEHLRSTRFDHYIFVPIALVCALATLMAPVDPAASSTDRRSLFALAAALAVGLLGLASDSATLARLGAVLAILGMGVYLGTFRWRFGLVLMLAIPLPAFVSNLTTPWAESAYTGLVDATLRAFGAGTERLGSLLLIEGRRLELFPEDAGLRPAVVGAALGLFSVLSETAAAASTQGIGTWLVALLRRSGVGALLGFACQAPGVVVAGLVVWAGSEAAGELILGTGIWLFVGLAGARWWWLRQAPPARDLRR